jgi:DNA polymerase III alpha subunit
MSTEYTQEQIIETVLRNGPESIELFSINSDWIFDYLTNVSRERLYYPLPKSNIQSNKWLIPEKYQTFDVETFCLDRCQTNEQSIRTRTELELFKKYNMLDVLKAMKYLVDVMTEHQIVWGVGRGSSVSSYVLHLLGLHKIDSIKYNLPIEEFFKGE